jgi:hypothetical protein
MRDRGLNFSNWIFSVWPLFLLVSQKAIIPLQVFFFLISEKEKLSKFIFLIFFSAGCFLTLFWLNDSLKNIFGFPHFLGFFLFLISVILIGHAFRLNSEVDLKWITIFNFISLILAFLFYLLDLDFSFLRGLNFIRGLDGNIHRVFIETTPLIVLNDYRLFNNKILNVMLFVLTFIYVFVLCKSFFIIIFFVWKLWMDHSDFIKSKIVYFIPLILVAVVFVGLELLSYLVRADLALSVLFKIQQFFSILNLVEGDFFLFGRGFGFVIEEFATDSSQPYQIEMQLPMLFLQFGILGILLFIFFILSVFYISGVSRPFQSSLMYFSVGFVNPWLFLPIWFLTCCYFFRK